MKICENGLLALNAFLTHPREFDGALFDVEMPVMDGLTATKLIRACETAYIKNLPIPAMPMGAIAVDFRQWPLAYSPMPIYAVTAGALEEQMNECMMAGMQGVLLKPLKKHELTSTLEVFRKRKTV